MDPLELNSRHRLLGAMAYVPGLFLLVAFWDRRADFHIWHAKQGLGLSLLFFIPMLTSAFISISFGAFLYFLWSIWAIWGVATAALGTQKPVPGLSVWAQNIPLEKWFPINPPSNPL